MQKKNRNTRKLTSQWEFMYTRIVAFSTHKQVFRFFRLWSSFREYQINDTRFPFFNKLRKESEIGRSSVFHVFRKSIVFCLFLEEPTNREQEEQILSRVGMMLRSELESLNENVVWYRCSRSRLADYQILSAFFHLFFLYDADIELLSTLMGFFEAKVIGNFWFHRWNHLPKRGSQ